MIRFRSIVFKIFILGVWSYPLAVLACPDLGQAPHSRWRLETQSGVSWLINPCGEPFFSIGVNVLDGGAAQRWDNGRLWYDWRAFYPSLDAWVQNTINRLTSWGFNTAGGWSLAPDRLLLPSTPDLELGRGANFHWSDPFHPDMEYRLRQLAERLIAPYKGNPYRIGYFSDNEVGWWNGALFIYYIKKPPSNYTKRQLVELLRSHYDDDWKRFSKDFTVPQRLGSFRDLLQTEGVIARLRPGGNGIQVVRRWTGLVAGHYYRLVYQVLKQADPDGLVLGDRLPIYYDPEAVRAMAPYVDVISTNYNVDSPDGWVAPYFFEGLRKLSGGKPILVSEWFFAAHENRTGNVNNGHLMTVKTQTDRAAGASRATRQFARQPQVVGLHWFQFYDHPKGGRNDGEDYNFGLVDVYDRPYEELIAALSQVNALLPALHSQAVPVLSLQTSSVLSIPKAQIDPTDKSLADWPKEYALLPAPRTPDQEVPFGEFYMSWSSAGLNLALIAMDYYDLDLLDYEGDFPLQEAFRVDWGLDCGGGPKQYTLYMIPPRWGEGPKDNRYNMRPYLCRNDSGSCLPVPEAAVSYFGADQPRIAVELTMPWKSAGCEQRNAGDTIRTEIAATAFHRSRWMSLSGQLPVQALSDAASWQTVKLK